MSWSGQSLGSAPETGLASGLASAGQDISRAVNATRTQTERNSAVEDTYNKLTLQNMGLKNELLASQIAKLRASSNPPMPEIAEGDPATLSEDKLDKRTPLVMFGRKLLQNHGFSDGQTFEDRWGEWGGGAAGLAVLAADLLKSGHALINSRRRSRYGAREAWH